MQYERQNESNSSWNVIRQDVWKFDYLRLNCPVKAKMPEK